MALTSYERTKRWRTNNPEKARDANARRHREFKRKNGVSRTCAYYRKQDSAGFIKRMFKSAKDRAEKYGLAFNIVLADIVIPEKCPILGIPLIFGDTSTRGPNPSAPSLDRKIPALGYVVGNIAVISHRANRLKSDLIEEELLAILAYLRSCEK